MKRNFKTVTNEGMLQAIARVYANGLIAAGSTSASIRRKEAREDVMDFLDLIKNHGGKESPSTVNIDDLDV